MVYEFDPLRDPRWPRLVDAHPHASVFHTPGWLQALRRTYGYRVEGLTTSGSGETLADGLVFCRVRSRLTGDRLVSLPFSDHCTPLADAESLDTLVTTLQREAEESKVRYFELRPASMRPALPKAEKFCLHRLDLRPQVEELFRGFHKSCVQRCIRRGERERLRTEAGRSEELLRRFYALTVQTRRRQQLPPQPFGWFRNLVESMGDRLTIRLASKDGRAVAGILTLQHQRKLTCKYGCSDRGFSRLGGTQLLIWEAIQEAKQDGLEELDFGRSEWDNPGLIAFKDRWGATRSPLVYYRYPAGRTRSVFERARLPRRIFALMPGCVLTAAGRILYRHFA